MIEVHILIPAADNGGAPFNPGHHLAFEKVVLARFGGLSLLPGTISGKWIGQGGATYSDTLREYVVAMASILDVGRLVEVLGFALSHYRQESIYFSYLGHAETYDRKRAAA